MKNEMYMGFMNSQVVQQFSSIKSGKPFTRCIQNYTEGKKSKD